MAALLAGVTLVPGLLAGLVYQLRQTLRQLSCLVPARQPLPAVPLYLPTASGASGDQSTDPELQARHQLAETVQKVMSVLRAAGLLERCALHYLTALKQACHRTQCEQVSAGQYCHVNINILLVKGLVRRATDLAYLLHLLACLHA